MISKLNKLCVLALLTVVLAGCSSITNLTPTQFPRSTSGYYRVEAMWNTKRAVIRPDSFKPLVVVDFQTYPMHPIPVVSNRWEAFIPVSPDKDFVRFHYKFDFLDNSFGKPKADSLMSQSYQFSVK